jgi:hypothetical protein
MADYGARAAANADEADAAHGQSTPTITLLALMMAGRLAGSAVHEI